MLAKRHSKAILGLLPLVLLSLTSCGEPDPPGNGTLSLNVADWVPAFEHEGQWRVVPVGGASEDSVTSTDPNATIELPAGRYDVYWIQGYPQEDAPMLLAGDVRVETGQETTVDANSGIHVDQADWVPTFGHEGWWGAVPTGKALSDRVDWTDDDLDLLLPPGTYDVYWVQDYHHAKAPMLLGRDLLVEQGKRTSLDGGSGIHLDLAEWIPEFGHEGWWGAVPTGKALSDRVDWSDGDSNLLLPPGNYDVYWVQDYHHAKDPMRLARDLRVESGKTTSLDARSGIHLNQADWVPALGHEGWWGAVPTGKALSNRVDWSIGAKHLLLPPGNYDVYWVQDYNHAKAPMRLARDVLVEAGEATRVDASSGIRLDLAEAVPDIGHNGWWGAVPAGKNVAERIDWSSAKDAPLLLPVGTYDVYWKQDSNSEATRIHEAVVVHLGQLIEVSDSKDTRLYETENLHFASNPPRMWRWSKAAESSWDAGPKSVVVAEDPETTFSLEVQNGTIVITAIQVEDDSFKRLMEFDPPLDVCNLTDWTQSAMSETGRWSGNFVTELPDSEHAAKSGGRYEAETTTSVFQQIEPPLRQWGKHASAESCADIDEWPPSGATGQITDRGQNKLRTGWMPKRGDGKTATLELGYETAVVPDSISVWTLLTSPWLTRVEAWNSENSSWMPLWEGIEPEDLSSIVFQVPFEAQRDQVERLRITVDTETCPPNGICGVEMVGHPAEHGAILHIQGKLTRHSGNSQSKPDAASPSMRTQWHLFLNTATGQVGINPLDLQ